MATGHDIPDIDRKGLRDFGLVTGGLVAVLFGLLFPWLLEHAFPIWPWGVAAVLAVWGLTVPHTMRPLYRFWMRFGLLMNRITTPIVLGLIFFLVITPTSLIMWLIGRDAMSRKLDREAKSYRIGSHHVPKNRMEKPY